MNNSPYFKTHDPAGFEELAPNKGCIVSNRISIEDKTIRYMTRDYPQNPADSGWAFFSGINEDEAYTGNPDNFQVFSLNTLANIDKSIIPLLDASIGSAFEKLPGQEEWKSVEN